ncbi:DUF6368 family protein [Streptomyces sp. NPDC007883]|uniref:DUF6368 family protein n=1 Tax=Streptomyces sp. NPDC007883 TaxID=3155116 RepID=UPI0033F3C2E1
MSEESEDVFAEYGFGGFERRPVQETVVPAYCQGRADHRLLGHPAASPARRLGALIGGNGLTPVLRPRRRPGPGRRRTGGAPDAGPGPRRSGARGPVTLAETRALVRDLGGVAHEDPYAAGRQVEYTHVCDAASMESWLRHPEFRTVG